MVLRGYVPSSMSVLYVAFEWHGGFGTLFPVMETEEEDISTKLKVAISQTCNNVNFMPNQTSHSQMTVQFLTVPLKFH